MAPTCISTPPKPSPVSPLPGRVIIWKSVHADKVRQLQEQINVIAGAYPAIPKIAVDGIYGPATSAAVRKFQSVFGLPATGITDYKTWYKISEIYVGVSRIAELV